MQYIIIKIIFDLNGSIFVFNVPLLRFHCW